MPIGSRAGRFGLALVGLALAICMTPVRGEAPRVISLAPHLTELAYAAGAGDTLVGAVAWSDYPESAQDLARIGDAFQLNLERITMLKPTLALAWEGGTSPASAKRLEATGIQTIWVRIRSLDDIGTALAEIGRRLGRTASGAQAAARFRAALAARPSVPETQRQPAFYQISEQPLFTLGKRHILSEVLHRCGAYNVFDDLAVEAAPVDFETVIARRPVFIIAGAQSIEHDALARWRRYLALLPENVRLVEVNPDTLIRPTPRIIDGMDQLCQKLR